MKRLKKLGISSLVAILAFVGFVGFSPVASAQSQPGSCGSYGDEWSSGLNPGTGPEWQPSDGSEFDNVPPFSNGPQPGTGPEWSQGVCPDTQPNPAPIEPSPLTPLTRLLNGLGF